MTSAKTRHRYQERINLALMYIQENLEHALTLERLADVACLSAFHFHRIFKSCTGETVNHYIKRLRLERAAQLLRYTRLNLNELPQRCGYASSASLSKAFTGHFGLAPGQYREQRDALPAVGPQPLYPAPAVVPPHEFLNLPRRKVLYVRRVGPFEQAATQAWEALMRFVMPRRLLRPDSLYLGVSHDDPAITDEDSLRYEACVTVDDAVGGEGEIGTQYVGGGRYCVFHVKGQYHDLWRAYDAIYGVWLQHYPGQLANRACFVSYRDDPDLAGGKIMAIYISVAD